MPATSPRRFALGRPRSLQAQFTVGLVGLVLLGAAAGVVAVAALRRSANATRRLAEQELARLDDAQGIVRLSTLVDGDGDGLVAAAELDAVRAAHASASRHLDELDALVGRLGGSSASLAVLDLHASGQAVRNTVHLVAQLREELLRRAAGDANRVEQQASLGELHGELTRKAAALIASAQAVAGDATREYRAAVRALANAASRDRALVFALVVASLIAAVLIAWLLLGRRVLGRLQQVSEQLRHGDPRGSPHLSVEGGDEIAHMARAVETFLEDRRRLVEAERLAERRKAEEALRATEAELARAAHILSMGEMATTVAHEVNQPLTGIVLNGKACLRWLSGDPPDLAEARAAVAHIVDDATRAAEIISRIRALTTTRDRVARGPVDVNQIVDEVRLLTRAELERAGVSFRAELGGDLPDVVADRSQTQQVLLNLVINAVDAMRDVSGRPRELLVRTERHGAGQLLVSVRDSGAGLDPDARPRIFDPFYTTKPGGMGLGLAISRSIVESHGGRLWAEPNEDQGATFCFTLPVSSSRGART